MVVILYKYARENLALVNIYIKDPAVTKIKRDQRVPIIWFIANVGGILGLTMGCSLVTVFEIIHHILIIFLHTGRQSVSRCVKRKKITWFDETIMQSIAHRINAASVKLTRSASQHFSRTPSVERSNPPRQSASRTSSQVSQQQQQMQHARNLLKHQASLASEGGGSVVSARRRLGRGASSEAEVVATVSPAAADVPPPGYRLHSGEGTTEARVFASVAAERGDAAAACVYPSGNGGAHSKRGGANANGCANPASMASTLKGGAEGAAWT